MANKINQELKDKVVIARKKEFKCVEGFGCSPNTNGCKILGYFVNGELNSKGEPYMEFISGYEVEKIII
jgi:hypothetical protein